MLCFREGRAFSVFGETGAAGANAVASPKKKSTIGVKASAAEAGKYTREAGVLAYYEVMSFSFLQLKKNEKCQTEEIVFFVFLFVLFESSVD